MKTAEFDLIHRYMARELTRAEEHDLLARLRQNRPLREMWFTMIENEALLHDFGENRTFSVLAEQRPTAAGGTETTSHDFEVRAASHGARFPSARVRPARPAPSAWGWWVTGIAAVALIGIGVLLHRQFEALQPQPSAGLMVVRQVSGAVQVIEPSRTSPAQPGMRLSAGTELRTGRSGSARLELAGILSIALQPETGFRAPSPTAGVAEQPGSRSRRLCGQVTHGLATVSVTDQRDTAAVVETPDAEIAVLGTRFRLTVRAGATRVDMSEGRARVTNKHTAESLVLSAGQYALVDTRRTVAHRTTPPAAIPSGMVVRYVFDEGRGLTVHDSAGFGAPLDLAIRDPRPIRWLAGGGLEVTGRALITSGSPAAKIREACTQTGEFSLELWVRPGRPPRGGDKHRLVTLRAPYLNSDFDLSVTLDGTVSPWIYLGKVKTLRGNQETRREVTYEKAWRGESIHFVLTCEAAGALRLYADGALRGADREAASASFANWEDHAQFCIANGPEGKAMTLGTFYLVAVYNRALSEQEVRARYRLGPPNRQTLARR